MAKRMKFSVVGLPHYTIWHLYEPSVDDIRHMKEMEKERQAKEAEENAKKERIDKIAETFDSKNTDWEKEKAAVQDLVQKAKNEEKAEAEAAKAQEQHEEKKGEMHAAAEDERKAAVKSKPKVAAKPEEEENADDSS